VLQRATLHCARSPAWDRSLALRPDHCRFVRRSPTRPVPEGFPPPAGLERGPARRRFFRASRLMKGLPSLAQAWRPALTRSRSRAVPVSCGGSNQSYLHEGWRSQPPALREPEAAPARPEPRGWSVKQGPRASSMASLLRQEQSRTASTPPNHRQQRQLGPRARYQASARAARPSAAGRDRCRRRVLNARACKTLHERAGAPRRRGHPRRERDRSGCERWGRAPSWFASRRGDRVLG
jgi:hypothetical protein